MPMTTWEDINGKLCSYCHKPASHFYGYTPVCCQCHGGNACSVEETAQKNNLATILLKVTKELLGWEIVNLSHKRLVDDDGCLSGNRCSECGVKYGKPHKDDCRHMNSYSVWKTSDEIYDDTGDPKHYLYVSSWNPIENADHTLTALRESLKKYQCEAITFFKDDGNLFKILIMDPNNVIASAKTRACIGAAVLEAIAEMMEHFEKGGC